MATLNVKNFPDALYKKLKEQAKREGRSVASELTVLVAESLARPGRYTVYDLKGLGKGTWKGVDILKWIDRERDSW